MTDATLHERAFHEIQRHFVEFGRAPTYLEVGATLGLSPHDARELYREVADAAAAGGRTPDTDYIYSWGPFSNQPTQLLVSVEGEQRWYAQCGLEAVAVSWQFPGKTCSVASACLDCGEPVSLRMKDGEVLTADPAAMVVHLNTPFEALFAGEASLAGL